LTALLYASLAVVIEGLTCYAVDAIVTQVKKNYTYTSTRARSIVVSTGLGVTHSETSWKWYRACSYFYHYHTANRNGAHSFYGLPK